MSTTATPPSAAPAAQTTAQSTQGSASAAPPPAGALGALSAAALKLRDRMLSGVTFRAFVWLKLPLAAFAGLRVTRLDAERCEVTLPAGWRTRNPFGSIYFAAHAMAAEMSTGAIMLMHAANHGEGAISTLVSRLSAEYKKAAKETVTYRCEDGPALALALRKAAETGEALECPVKTRGYLKDGTVAAEFTIVWSMKKRSGKPK